MRFWAFMLMAGLYFTFSMARAAEPQWGLNDVTFLLPIDDASALRELPKLDTEGRSGLLLPPAVSAKFPLLLPAEQSATLASMRLVGVRIDPCFPAGASETPACIPQIRFVWQPVVAFEVSRTTPHPPSSHTTQDAALHTFYTLNDGEFARLLAELKLARALGGLPQGNTSEPLQVNPSIQRQGLQGAYFQALKQTLLSFTGAGNLTRATFMTNHVADNVWDFGGVDVAADGTLTSIQIPRANGTLQRFVNPSGMYPQPIFFAGQIMPRLSVENDDITMLASNSRQIRPIEDEQKIIVQARAAARIQNPRVHNPNTMDCVSCHVAQTAFRFADRQFPWLMLSQRLAADTYRSSTFSNTNNSPQPDRTDNARAFGYFRHWPAISQRVINETIEVCEVLNAGTIR